MKTYEIVLQLDEGWLQVVRDIQDTREEGEVFDFIKIEEIK